MAGCSSCGWYRCGLDVFSYTAPCHPDAQWLCTLLNNLGAPFATQVQLLEDNTIRLSVASHSTAPHIAAINASMARVWEAYDHGAALLPQVRR